MQLDALQKKVLAMVDRTAAGALRWSWKISLKALAPIIGANIGRETHIKAAAIPMKSVRKSG